MVQFDVTEGRYSAGDASLYAEPNNPIDMAEKIVALLGDPDRREEMGKLGRRRVSETLGWTHQIGPLLGAYKQALGLD